MSHCGLRCCFPVEALSAKRLGLVLLRLQHQRRAGQSNHHRRFALTLVGSTTTSHHRAGRVHSFAAPPAGPPELDHAPRQSMGDLRSHPPVASRRRDISSIVRRVGWVYWFQTLLLWSRPLSLERGARFVYDTQPGHVQGESRVFALFSLSDGLWWALVLEGCARGLRLSIRISSATAKRRRAPPNTLVLCYPAGVLGNKLTRFSAGVHG